MSVPLWSSEAKMSPATSAVMSGNSHTAPNSSMTSGTTSPLLVRYDANAKSPPPAAGRGGSGSASTNRIGTSAAAPSPRYVRFW